MARLRIQESKAPQSPRGDYDQRPERFRIVKNRIQHPKHLNPREGITTAQRIARVLQRVRHPKHLNPREGITTRSLARRCR